MERLLVKLTVPQAYAGRQTIAVVADEDSQFQSAESLDAGRYIEAEEPRWCQDGFLAGVWLGGEADECWLEEDWSVQEHLLGSRRVEVISWRMYFGDVYAEARIEEPNGQAGLMAVASEQITVNSSPEPPSRFRLKGQDANGRVGFAFEASESFVISP